MSLLLDVVIWVHVALGFAGLAAFWVPIVTRKGGRSHVWFGRIFAWSAYVVTLSAVVAAVGRALAYRADGIALADRPELYGFAFLLGYLGLATFASVRHAVRVIQTRRAPETIRTPFHAVLPWLAIGGSAGSIAFALGAWSEASPILLALSPVGIGIGVAIRKYLAHAGNEHMGWWYSHMRAMIGGGIAFHTAFAVFGAQRIWEYSFEGVLGALPWVLPALIGLPASAIWTAYYRRRFGKAAAAAAA